MITYVFKSFWCKFNVSMKIAIHGIVANADEPKLVCPECGKMYSGEAKLKWHLKDAHSQGGEVTCDLCGKICRNEHGLYRHKKKVHDKVPCVQCGLMTSNARMKYHILQKHTDCSKMPFVCEICKKGFAYKRFLDIHMNTHTGEKPFKCKYCDLVFGDPANAYAHERSVHKGVKRTYKQK